MKQSIENQNDAIKNARFIIFVFQNCDLRNKDKPEIKSNIEFHFEKCAANSDVKMKCIYNVEFENSESLKTPKN